MILNQNHIEYLIPIGPANGGSGLIPQNINPAYDDTEKYCSECQSGAVWLLTSSYKHPVDRFRSIPSEKSILFTILNSECSFAEFPNLKTENQLRQCAKQMQDSVVSLQASTMEPTFYD